MSQFMDAVHAVQQFVQQPISDFSSFPQDETQFLDEACFADFLHVCRPAAPEVRNEALTALVPLLASVPDAFQASRVAMLCGILVEWGADPRIALGAILERLTTSLTAAATIAPRFRAEDEATLFAEAPEAVKAWKALHYFILPAMTMLCLDVNGRQAARRNATLVDGVRALAPVHRDVKFLDRLFRLVDGEELIVLHPGENKGFRVRLEAVCSNFHLFTLLQGALIGEADAGLLTGPRPNRKVIATATGELPHDRVITDAPVWHYANWMALGAEGPPDATALAGEVSPIAIPEFEGDRVVLLGKPLPGARSWDSTFFTNLHDALRSKVEIVEILSAGEVETRLRRIMNAPRL